MTPMVAPLGTAIARGMNNSAIAIAHVNRRIIIGRVFNVGCRSTPMGCCPSHCNAGRLHDQAGDGPTSERWVPGETKEVGLVRYAGSGGDVTDEGATDVPRARP